MLSLFTKEPEGGVEGYLPGALWKDCERIRGRPGEVMSALKMSPQGHGGEPWIPTLGLATLKSKTRDTHAWGDVLMHTHDDKTEHKEKKDATLNLTCSERVSLIHTHEMILNKHMGTKSKEFHSLSHSHHFYIYSSSKLATFPLMGELS